jgi:hypothetical protein
MNITRKSRIELGDLVDFIATAKGIDYSEAENLIPSVYFEGCSICDDQGDEDWCKEVVAYLIEEGIDSVEVYQDS